MKALIFLLFIGLTKVFSSPKGDNKASNYTASFQNDFYFAVAEKNPDKNLIISPISVTMSLGLTFMGASGTTADEFRKTLHFESQSQKKIAQHYGNMFTQVKSKSQGNMEFSIANSIYIDKSFSIALKYEELVKKHFGSEMEKVSFKQSEAAAKKINTFVEEQTHDKIKNIVNSRDFGETTKAVLVNAIYFKAPWLYPFEKLWTRQEDFYLSSMETIKVDMMSVNRDFDIAEWPLMDATAIRIRYANSDVYMLVMLPNTMDGLMAMEAKLQKANLTELQATLKSRRVNLKMPKFKFEFDLSLVPVLREMGLKTMFTGAADFSAMVSDDSQLKVSEVKHKAYISVDEEGTEAAAAAFGIVQLLSMPPSITVDHSFMFEIRDKETVYFAGHVVNF